jgi:hypothetical protein
MGNHSSSKKKPNSQNHQISTRRKFGSETSYLEKYMIFPPQSSDLTNILKKETQNHRKSVSLTLNQHPDKLTDFDELEDHLQEEFKLDSPSFDLDKDFTSRNHLKYSNRKKLIENRKKFLSSSRKYLGTERLPDLTRVVSFDFGEEKECRSVERNEFRRLNTSKKKKSRRTIVSYDLEKINFKNEVLKVTEKEALLLFSVPFHKRLIHVIDYHLRVTKVKNFVSFYKSFDENERKLMKKQCFFADLLQTFPTRWKKGKVPYFIDNSLLFIKSHTSLSIYNVIQQAIKEFEVRTCIKFVSFVESKHSDFLYFESGNTNSALIGKIKGKNLVTVKKTAEKEDVLHLIMHCLGFMHVHKKGNDEEFLYLSAEQVNDKSFIDDKDSHFCIYGLKYAHFDSDSVLMKKSCQNMISYHNFEFEERGLSEMDVFKVNFYYDNENFNKSEEELKSIMQEFNKDYLNESMNENSISSSESNLDYLYSFK